MTDTLFMMPVRRESLKPLVYAAGLLPAAVYVYLGITDRLGADPVRALEHALGLWSLRFLVIGLAITPLRRLGGPNLVIYRRAIGLLAFFYALMHLGVYIALDRGLDWQAIAADILRRPYITIGMISFALLVPLAITSHNSMMRRLGGPAWRRLHKLTYPAAIAAALHFVLVVKSWPPEPLVYAALIGALLLIRAIDVQRLGGQIVRACRFTHVSGHTSMMSGVPSTSTMTDKGRPSRQ